MKGIPLHRPKDWEGRRVTRRKDNWYQPANDVKKYSSVVFVPATPGSALTNILQQQEEKNHQGRATRFVLLSTKRPLFINSLCVVYPLNNGVASSNKSRNSRRPIEEIIFDKYEMEWTNRHSE